MCDYSHLFKRFPEMNYQEFKEISEMHKLNSIPLGVAIEVQTQGSTLFYRCPWCPFNIGQRVYNFVENGKCQFTENPTHMNDLCVLIDEKIFNEVKAQLKTMK